LQPKEGLLYKIVTFVPTAYSGKVRDALFAADAGHIGNYDSCSYSLDGTGTFRADKNTRPFVGKKDELHTEPETRIETVVRRDGINAAVAALLQSHPYEEPAYDIYPLENRFEGAGLGAYGVLPQPVDAQEIFDVLREKLSVKVIRHNALFKKVQTIAVCGGAGANLTDRALSVKADMLITGDCKYHNFVDLQNRIILADAGHFESEYFAVEILYDVIIKNLSNFAVYFAQGIENPVQYYF
jgi:hypothetical protein